MRIYDVLAVGMMAGTLMLTGCRAFQAGVSEVDLNQPGHMRATYDFKDMRNMTEEVAAELLQSPMLAAAEAPPVIMVAGVKNATTGYVDTKPLTTRIRTILVQSGKAQFVNEARRDELMKEQGFQAANVTPETQVAIGRQTGARYMLSGTLTEMEQRSPREVRLSRKEINYYNLTMEVTDLQTGLIAWTTEREFARKASLPLIGW